MIYEWDPDKASENLKKHKVSFDEAASAFADPFALTFDDPDHSLEERRYITIGTSSKPRIVFISHADRGDDHVRIISAGRRHQRKPMPTKNLASSRVDELRPEYDLASLTGRVQGKYHARATAGTTMVLLEPDVAEVFTDGKSVNQTLRSYLRTSRGKLPALQPTSRTARRQKPKRTKPARG